MSSVDPKRTQPLKVKAPRGAQVMNITWADGHEGVLPHDTLRGYCPCAHCQGHGGTIEYVPGGNTELREIEQVGGYALQLTWGDLHSSGIYSFRYLRSLCQCEACKPTFSVRTAP
jgi:prepilin-type processing-associated H-X9-DG protein